MLFRSIKQIEAPYIVDWEHGFALHPMQWNLASFRGKREVSLVFSSYGMNLGYIPELRGDGHLKLECVQ